MLNPAQRSSWVHEMGTASAGMGLAFWFRDIWTPLLLWACLMTLELANKHKCPPSAPWEASDLGCLSTTDAVPSPALFCAGEGKRNVTGKWKHNLHLIFPKSLFEAYLLFQQFCDRYRYLFCVTSVPQSVFFFFLIRDHKVNDSVVATICLQRCLHTHIYI